MATAERKKKKQPKRHRASWKGTLVFGLVSFPVEAFNALNRDESDIHFHQLHADCHRRIQYQKVCPLHGEVSNDEIVSGYEYKTGKYIEVEPEELETIKTKADRAFTIDAFVDPATIDPLYLDGRMYYLLPAAPAAAEPYVVMAQAMTKENQFGVGKIVIFGKEQLALVRSIEGLLHMAMLNFDEEIRAPQEMKARLPKANGAARQVTLARTLIRNWATEKFDFRRYDDEYRKRVARLIKAKVAGHEVVAPPKEEAEPDVINLMEALQRSVAAESKERKPAKKRRKKKSA